MQLGVPRETGPGERRVAATPATVKKLTKWGYEVVIEAGAGAGAKIDDAAYEEAGATIDPSGDAAWGADVVLKVNAPAAGDERHEVDRLKDGATIASLVFPVGKDDLLKRYADKSVTALALDQVPRISRAQKMDVLSSMANIAGYRAVIEASHHYSGFFAGQMTAAGRTRPAQVLIIGAGVAGLAAIAAARGLGAEVYVFDVRPAVKEQAESLGARFLLLDVAMEGGETSGGYADIMSDEFIAAEMALFREKAKDIDIVITTALIPGKKAPVLFTEDMVETMKTGGVVVDLAAEQGGNCALTEADKVVVKHGVTIIGYTDMTSRLAAHASQFFATNLTHLLDDMGKHEDFKVDLEDIVVRKALVAHEGAVTWPCPPEVEEKARVAAQPPKPEADASVEARKAATPAKAGVSNFAGGLVASAVGVAALYGIGMYAPSEFMQHFTVFVLSCFIGWQVVWNVTPALHTPLMSVTNAISGIIIVGGILQATTGEVSLATILGAVAVLVASINIAGGFLVTQRMLAMFRKEA